ncbi:MAG TPA: GAF domain-containing sensor histidine kinase [Candidatus Limnocylindrales bacterium]|nr:GAF domain-containing sensor histidine kinase [Candidatus Limnocylindrales bacterium]
MGTAHQTPESQGEGALLSWIQQFAPYGVITLDRSFGIKSWNHWMEIHSSKRFQDVRGKDLFDLFRDLRQRRLASYFERALEGEASVLSSSLHQYLLPLPSPFPEPDFALMLQTARIAPLFSGGSVCGVVVVIEDVTQRERQAEELRRQHRRDEILSWALAHLLKAEQPRKSVRQLFFKVAEHLDFDSFLLYLRDVETGILSLFATGGLPTPSTQDFSNCRFSSLLVPQSHTILVLNSVQQRREPEYSALKHAGVSAAVVIPLVANERDLGLLCFATSSRSSISPGESDLLTTIGQYLATALDRENTSLQLYKAKEELSDHARLLEKRVQERTAQLRESVAELETFTYTLAHDLKAPIRGITGYCDILLHEFHDDLSPRSLLILNKVARTSERMDVLVKDLLAFSKVSQQSVVLTRLEIEPIIEDILALRAPEVRQALTVVKPLHRVFAHKELLQQVLSNLIDNAWKFVNPKTSPKITIRSEIVVHSSPTMRSRPLVFSANDMAEPDNNAVAAASQHVRLWVIDEGIGIPHEVHHKIFRIFERGVTSLAYEGTGMGLAIVARAMQRMAGSCGVESAPGTGSRFWIMLPVA